MKWITSTHSQHPGPIPTFQNQYGCIQEVVYYSANLTSLRSHDGVMSGNLTNSPCGKGNYFITAVAHTNLFLLVVEDYRSTSGPFNFNCHIKNRYFVLFLPWVIRQLHVVSHLLNALTVDCEQAIEHMDLTRWSVNLHYI